MTDPTSVFDVSDIESSDEDSEFFPDIGDSDHKEFDLSDVENEDIEDEPANLDHLLEGRTL